MLHMTRLFIIYPNSFQISKLIILLHRIYYILSLYGHHGWASLLDKIIIEGLGIIFDIPEYSITIISM